MNDTHAHSPAWIAFSYANMIAALAMTFGGLLFLPLEIWIKGYMAMGVTMLVSSTVILTKTLRDRQEAGKLVNKIEEAKTERLLASIK